jgi:hypothetical protein
VITVRIKELVGEWALPPNGVIVRKVPECAENMRKLKEHFIRVFFHD